MIKLSSIMNVNKTITSILFILILSVLSAKSQVPIITMTFNSSLDSLFYKQKTTWITLTPISFTQKKFSPDKGENWERIGMFGRNLRPYLQTDSIGTRNINNYRNSRILGITEMVIGPLLIYKYILNKNSSPLDQTDEDQDLYVQPTDETGLLPIGILVFATGVISYHFISKKYLTNALQRLKIVQNPNSDPWQNLSLNFKLDNISNTPQVSLVLTF
ncbi:MAG: hypothetical protein PF487_06430 [Bacteroidales bacterium]|jgi:hypothetical protein|nr:hypothetical protein [Bacteroidales bacterium]